MYSIFRYVEAIAGTSLPVLITGETGTGKELLAESVHEASGRSGEFVAVNVAGLDDTLFSDTLFGHIKGAYSSATDDRDGMIKQASGGTLFLDEIGDLSTASQVKLLRLLQEREYIPLGADRPSTTDARFVFATNRDLGDAVRDGEFRQDLYYRLRSHQLRIPALRERKNDVPLLVSFFIENLSDEIGKTVPRVPSSLLAKLMEYEFPGNIRELQGMIYDSVVRYRSGELTISKIDAAGAADEDRGTQEDSTYGSDVLKSFADLPSEDQFIRMITEEALRRSGGNQSAASRILGVDRSTLAKRIKKYEL